MPVEGPWLNWKMVLFMMMNIGHLKKVLLAAALTYVAATLVAIGQLLRLMAMSGRRRD